MDGSSTSSSSSINSRSTAIKTILLAAWRAKLTDDEWENRIRKVLPRGVNGDVYDLADCLLKQALIGPVPNQLFISYLKHAVHCELVSHSAVLRSIANQPINLRSSSSLLLYRTSSIVCLLEFLKLFRDKISCNGTEIECLNLCHSLSNLIHWLLKCILQTIDHIITTNTTTQSTTQQLNNYNNITGTSSLSTTSNSASAVGNQQLTGASINLSTNNGNSSSSNNNNPGFLSGQNGAIIGIIDLCIETIHYFIDRPFTKSLLFISKIEDTKSFEENILKTIQSIQQKLVSCPELQAIQEKVQHFNMLQQLNLTFNSKALHPSVVAAQQLRYLQTHRIRSTQITSSSNFEKRIQQYSALPAHDSSTNYALFNSVYPLVAFDAILRPACPNEYLARQIVTITTFNYAPVSMTYCELIRVCLIGLIDAHGNAKAKQLWSFFTFLKLPRLLIELNRLFTLQQEPSSTSSKPDVESVNLNNDLKQAFERLCEYSPLLDEAEYKCRSDFFKCLVNQIKQLDSSFKSQLKNMDSKNFPCRRQINLNNNHNNPPGGEMIPETETFVTEMLKTLNSEQDPSKLFSSLTQSCEKKSIKFECTLSAAAATGRFHLIVTRLVEHNELYKLPRDNTSTKNNHAQALNFDITFLILIYIAQRYGPRLIDKDQKTSTFNRWFHDCYNQESCFSCPKEMLKNCDQEVVTSLIRQLVSRNHDVQLRSINWHDVCFNLPMAIDEILNAWTQGNLNDDDIALVIERLRSKMCFMAVVAATWLRYHLRTLNEADKAKPLFILKSLTKPSQHMKQQQQQQQDPSNVTNLKGDGYEERFGLMCAIIKRISFELVPNRVANSGGSSNKTSRSALTSTGVSHGSTSNADSEESRDGTTYHSYKDRFLSTLTTQDIFLANVKQCLKRGWIDYDSLNSLSSLFEIIGSECFTNLIVDQILCSHESPSDLARAMNITFGLFHLDIEACAFALIKETIPHWLMSEKKQALMNQPRAFALANLAVMTIIEVYNNLKSTTSRKDRSFNLNGLIKQEPSILSQSKNLERIMDNIAASSAANGPRDAKRVKLLQEQKSAAATTTTSEEMSSDKLERLNKLNGYISNLMRLFKEIMSDPVMSHRTLFPVLFLQQTVVCAREESKLITVHLQPEILLDIIDLFSSEMTFELVLAISNLSSTNSRKYTAKAVCKLAQVKESKQRSPFGSCASDSSGQSGSASSSALFGYSSSNTAAIPHHESQAGGGGGGSAGPPYARISTTPSGAIGGGSGGGSGGGASGSAGNGGRSGSGGGASSGSVPMMIG